METNVASIKEQVFGIKPATEVVESATPVLTEGATVIEQPSGEGQPILNDAQNPISETPTPSPSAFDPSVFLKETFGLESADAIKSQLQRIQELEAKANTPTEYAYANEQAKLLANAINSGDFSPVKDYVDTQIMLSSLDGMSDEQLLKLHIKIQNPKFNDKHVDEEYNEMYVLNEDEIDESRVERERLKMEQKKSDQVQAAKTLFAEKKSKIVLPEIKAAVSEDPEYTAWKQQRDQQDAQRAANPEAYSKLVPKDIAKTFKFNDEANKLAFDISYEPDAESFGATIATILDDEKFLSNFAGQDGSLDRNKFAEVFYNGLNIEKIVNNAIVQTVNQTKLWFLKNQKNIGDGGVLRDFNMQPETEVQKLRNKVFG